MPSRQQVGADRGTAGRDQHRIAPDTTSTYRPAYPLGKGIEVPVEREVTVLGDFALVGIQEDVGREGGEGTEILLWEAIKGNPMGRSMHLAIGDIQPFPGTTVQVVQLGELPAVKEVILEVADRAFDFAFRFCPVDSAEAGGESEVVTEVDECGMEIGRS